MNSSENPEGQPLYSPDDIDRIIQMAWEDRTPFEAIEYQFQLNQEAVIRLLRAHLSPGSFRRWRERTKGRHTKHVLRRLPDIGRFKCSQQKAVSSNKISKRP